MNTQQFFDKACESLRNHGNQYGNMADRGWGWCNPYNAQERCAIARFIKGDSIYAICENVREELNLGDSEPLSQPIVHEITFLFDHRQDICNDKVQLEVHLQKIAERLGLFYKNPQVIETLSMIENT